MEFGQEDQARLERAAGVSALLMEVEDGIARLTLNRPDAGNALDMAMAEALVEAATRCETDRAIRCVVLTGAGRLFCAGGDIGLFTTAGDIAAVLHALATTLHGALVRFARMPKPMLVLVNGPAAGAGLSLALAGDVVLAGRSAHFTAAYAGIGLTPDGGMSWLLPRLVGLRKAQDIILTNRRVKAEEAEAIGMVTRVVDDALLAEEGRAMAERLSVAPVQALGVARLLLQQSFSTGLEEQLAAEASAISAAGVRPEAREGLAAFMAKRPPDFRRVDVV